jgi:hypothetical protein
LHDRLGTCEIVYINKILIITTELGKFERSENKDAYGQQKKNNKKRKK